jgi:hypothetical protein
MDIFVINMVPKSLSGETNQDSEPNLAVDPSSPHNIAATAFTSDPLSGPLAPVYVSTDGGHTWALNMLAPGGSSTHDITVHFGSVSHVLYAGILRQDDAHLNILRTGSFTGPGPMTILEDRGNEDQPWVESITAESVPGKPDRIYVGNNDFSTSPKTATIDLSQSAATAPPPAGVAPHGICSRTPGSQNGPPTRPAAHQDGTVYAIYVDWQNPYFGNGNYTCDVVVCRDDNWGQGATPFQALVDPIDHKGGYRVAASTTMPWQNGVNFMGQERGGTHVAIAVDPKNSSRLFVAWADYPGGNPPLTLHMIRSTDRGNTWTKDLRTVESALNPALAIDEHGRVAFLYQTLTHSGATWETHVEVSDDGFSGAWSTHVLSTTPSSAPTITFYPYLGDYVRLQAVGEEFYGVFCANNTPDHANFPSGVVYQRNANFATHTLLAVDDVTPVDISIDPFFFKIIVKPSRVVTALPNSGAFGDVCLGSFADELLTINNAGTGPLVISNITSSSSQFLTPGVLKYPIVLAPGASVDLVVRFEPTSYGLHTGTLTVFSNDPHGPHKIPVSGHGAAPRLSLVLANKGFFGNCCVGSHVDEPLILDNSGKCTLSVTSITSSSPEFEVPEVLTYPLTVGAGDSLPIPIRFKPTSFGAESAAISITSNDPASPATIHVSGEAPSGKLAVTGSTHFGGVTACCCADRTISICNVGDCALRVTSVHLKHKSRHWKLINNPFPARLHPGSCLAVLIQYHAHERCSRLEELVIESNDPDTPEKTLELLAYTIWDGGCKCDDCAKGCCKKPGHCPQGYECCCEDEEEHQ